MASASVQGIVTFDDVDESDVTVIPETPTKADLDDEKKKAKVWIFWTLLGPRSHTESHAFLLLPLICNR